MLSFTFRLLPSFRWEVLRGEMVMAVFGTRAEALAYCDRKNSGSMQ